MGSDLREDLRKKGIINLSKSFKTFDEKQGRPDEQVIKACFHTYLQPIWEGWSGKKNERYDDKKNSKVDYFRFVRDVLANENTESKETISLAQKYLTSLTKTSPEVFHPYWTYDP